MTTTDRILAELRALSIGDPDPESAHESADRLLCEAIRELAPPADAAALIDAWRRVRKWYS